MTKIQSCKVLQEKKIESILPSKLIIAGTGTVTDQIKLLLSHLRITQAGVRSEQMETYRGLVTSNYISKTFFNSIKT